MAFIEVMKYDHSDKRYRALRSYGALFCFLSRNVTGLFLRLEEKCFFKKVLKLPVNCLDVISRKCFFNTLLSLMQRAVGRAC